MQDGLEASRSSSDTKADSSPAYFRLMDMPLEIFRAILVESVKARTVKRAMRLTLVSSKWQSHLSICQPIGMLKESRIF